MSEGKRSLYVRGHTALVFSASFSFLTHYFLIYIQEGDQEKAAVYRAMLIQAIHQCAVKFPDVADSVVHVLMDFLSGDGAIDVIVFVR